MIRYDMERENKFKSFIILLKKEKERNLFFIIFSI